MRKLFATITLMVAALIATAQVVNPVKWEFSQNKISDSEFELVLTAKIDKGWHLYSTDLPDGGPIKTFDLLKLSFYQLHKNLENVELVGDVVASKEATEEFDKSFQMDLRWFSDVVSFTQKVKVNGSGKVSGYLEFMSCNDETCTPPTDAEFSFDFSGDANAAAVVEATVTSEPEEEGEKRCPGIRG